MSKNRLNCVKTTKYFEDIPNKTTKYFEDIPNKPKDVIAVDVIAVDVIPVDVAEFRMLNLLHECLSMSKNRLNCVKTSEVF